MKPLVLIAFLLTACAQTRTSLLENGARAQFSSTREPMAVATCIARNADDVEPGLNSRITPGIEPNTVDYMLNSEVIGAYMIAIIKPDRSGSLISTYVNPNISWGIPSRDYGTGMT